MLCPDSASENLLTQDAISMRDTMIRRTSKFASNTFIVVRIRIDLEFVVEKK